LQLTFDAMVAAVIKERRDLRHSRPALLVLVQPVGAVKPVRYSCTGLRRTRLLLSGGGGM